LSPRTPARGNLHYTMQFDPDQILTHDAKLRRVARAVVRDAAAADDLVQRAWLSALRQRARLHSPLGWLLGAVRKLALENQRADDRRVRRERASASPEGAASTADVVAFESLRRRVFDAVMELDESLRRCVVQRYFEDLPPREIAKREGIAVAEVHARLARGITLLRHRLASLDREDPRNLFRTLAPFAAGAPVDGLASFAMIATGGLVVSSKGLIVFVVSVALVAAFAIFQSGTDVADNASPDEASDTASLAAPTIKQDDRNATAGAPPSVRDAVAVESTAATAETETPTVGSLLVRATFDPDGAVAANVALEIMCHAEVDPYSNLRHAHTDASGIVRFDGLPPGYVTVSAERGGMENVKIAAGEEKDFDFRIEAGSLVRGIVVDAAKRPVAGAEIFLSKQLMFEGAIVAQSGSDGRFAIRNVSSLHYVGARHDGFVPSTLKLILGSPDSEHEFELELAQRGGAVEGVVLDQHGAGAAGARILFDPENSAAGETGYGRDTLTAMPLETATKPDGTFRFGGTPTGRFAIQARARGHSLAVETVDIVRDGVSRVTFRLAPSGRLSGSIRDGSGAAVKGAGLRAESFSPLDSFWVQSDAAGEFVIDDISAGERDLIVEAAGYKELQHRVLIAAGQETRLALTLRKGAAIRGRVVDDQGVALVSADIEVDRPEYREGFSSASRVTTGTDGHFEVAGLDSDQPYTIKVRVQPWSMFPTHVERDVVPNGPEIRIVIPADRLPTVLVRGRVVDAMGKPLAGAELNLIDAATPGSPLFTSEGDGRFEYGPVPPGEYSLFVRVEGHPSERIGPRNAVANTPLDFGDVTIAAGQRLEVAVIRPPAFANAQLDFRVRRAGDAGRDSVEWTSPTIGVSDLLPPGTHHLLVAGEGVAAQAIEFTIELGRDARLTVTLEAGLSRALVLADSLASTRPFRATITREDGAIVGDTWFQRAEPAALHAAQVSLATGRYVLTHRAGPGAESRLPFEVTLEGPTQITLDKP
jgi:RNA polymerase sigma factor (sigma-70 family)